MRRVLAILVIGVLVGGCQPKGEAPVSIAIIDRFDTLTGDWTVTAGASVVTVDEDEKLRLNKTSAGTQISATRALSEPAGAYNVETDLFAPTNGRLKISLLAASDTEIASLDLNAGTATFDTDTASAQTTTYAQAEYGYFYLHVSGGTIRAGKSVHSANGAFAWFGAALAYSGTTVAKVRYETLGATTGAYYVDNLIVSTPWLVCIGDSLTAGSRGWSPDPEDTYRITATEDETYSYAYQLGALFSPQQWAVNRGIGGGQTSGGISARFADDAIALAPTGIVLMCGHNDLYLDDTSLETLKTNYHGMIDAAQAAGIPLYVCEIMPSALLSANGNTAKHAFNVWLGLEAGTHGLSLIKAHDAVASTPGGDALAATYNDDGTHLNKAGYGVLAQLLYQKLGLYDLDLTSLTLYDLDLTSLVAAGGYPILARRRRQMLCN